MGSRLEGGETRFRAGFLVTPAPDFPVMTITKRTPPSPRLENLAGVRRELARLYREARAGRLDVADASKLANILQVLGRMIEGAELEGRVEALEEASAGEGWR
jgi:hypothetical protein